MKAFKALGLSDEIIESISYMGFDTPTPIQEQSIPIILNKQDLIACAQTGTGKTAAFLLPILQLVSQAKVKGTKCLILAPTRELARQIDVQLQGLAYFTGVSSFPIYGGGDGDDWVKQKNALKNGTDIIVATPGKLISHLQAKDVNLKQLKFLVLDEADRMLDIGFYDDIITIIRKLPKKRQNLLFSATMNNKIRKLSSNILHQPKEINIAVSKPAEGILQAIYHVYEDQKDELILDLIKDKPKYERIVIFCSSKKKVASVYRALKKKNFVVEQISSDLDQKDRERVLHDFSTAKVRILVGTDVISRGIDIKNINLVINYDVPRDPEDYVHRVGRTARANTTGVAITLVHKKDFRAFQKIEKFVGDKIYKAPLPEHIGKEPQMSASKGHSRSKKSYRKKNTRRK